MSAASQETAAAKSVFPDTVVDRAAWTRYSTSEFFNHIIQVQEIVARLTENLHHRALEPDFCERNSGEVEAYGDCVSWLFEALNADSSKIQKFIAELDEERSDAIGGSP